LHILMGSTYVTGPTHNAAAVILGNAKARMMGTWRRTAILDSALNVYNPPRRLPLAPLFEEKISEGVLKILLGSSLAKTVNNAEAALGALPASIPALPAAGRNRWVTLSAPNPDAAFNAAAVALQVAWSNLHPGGPAPAITAFGRNEVFSCRNLRPQLLAALVGVVRARWDPSLDPNGLNWQDLDAALRRVFDILFVPQMFPAVAGSNPPKADADQPPINWNPQIQGAIQAQGQAVFTALYTPANRDHIVAMLDRYHFWVINDDSNLVFQPSLIKTYGRCAETHPVVALM
jgi:hypothetical protein